ncbi:hypothetical protein DL766_009584 [Monosporascus sp. MC13-8B]|uniref:Protein YAE1 n=1 Tax=Monosporascus cannonballus TaxID=155416 RepID=A0ABY0GUU8_9PEZI|nr:hypothetical protein DL762_010292 [Monosporascus cannonballus]RYO88086.1 hypothetical protein DL763_006109 [Monosporascus cannonballus]RYP14764.1 hypothetical protein DL766_009584 [Monosporascus sp. MC13-8B]
MHLPPPTPRADELYIQMAPAYGPGPQYEDPLDDVFGSDSETSPALGSHGPPHADRVLAPDVRRLQVTHSTEGYREGITAGKTQSIQAGFDEGYNLGANVGLKAGQLLGLLEGIAAALGRRRADADADADGSERASQLLMDARQELRTERIFDEAYWAPDGSWRYDVKGTRDDGEIVFEDVANEHPLVSKWTRIVHGELRRWDLNLDLPALRSQEAPNEDAAPKAVKLEKQSRQAMEW